MSKCPRCGSEAIYKYGFSTNKKRRYQCKACLLQFVENPSKKVEPERPLCPLCGCKMHVHHRRGKYIFFRCSTYPRCRGYISSDQLEMSEN